ncbi:uncharacterized protein LOC130670516 [Microplitis mediator]|uniref:uncharacterized protein LOC130670516 n=1 Tax=Microplitis mediator TaxID=375433 RepID=UPI0025558CDE|nr:uncharacterized protein LOC130670516 [Microplitis mediator]
MEIIPGKLPGSTLFFYNGYIYLEDKQCKKVAGCSSRKSGCKATLHFTEDISNIGDVRDLHEGIDFRVKKEHTDLPDVDCNVWKTLCEAMKEKATATTERLKDIFDSTSLVCPEVSSKHSFHSVRSILSRTRMKSRPKIPDTLDEMGKLLKSNLFLKGHVTSSSNKTGLIFSTDILLVGFSECSEIFMDSTFSRTAVKPKMEQIYTIHYKLKGTYIAAMMVLTENRDTSMYNAIFKWITNEFPDLKNKKIHIMSDFEKATVKALRNNFHGAQIHGCYFHFVQAVIKKWQAMKLKTPDSFLSLVLNVPLLPPDNFDDAEKILKIEIEKIKNIDINILIFLDYLKNTWQCYPDHVSVFNAPTNTNDGPENFNRYSNEIIGEKHPEFWTLLDFR